MDNLIGQQASLGAGVCPACGMETRLLGGVALCTACLGSHSAVSQLRLASLDARLYTERQANAILTAGIPPRFANASFDNYESPSPRADRLRGLLAGYTADFAVQRELRTGFLFLGLHGTGKTHLACAMARDLMGQGYSALYASLPALTTRIRGTYKAGTEETIGGITAQLVAADLLILDEIDLHGSSDADYQTLYDIINGRYEQPGRPTLAISNRPLELLRADLDERIISRILSGSPPISFDWASYRDALPARLRAAHAAATGASEPTTTKDHA